MTELSSGFVFSAAAYIVFLSALSGVAVMLTVETVEQPLRPLEPNTRHPFLNQ